MPKRKNPFGDSAPIQLKTHVGYNQCATDEEKKNVCDRTMALLFQGANPHLKNIPSVFTVNGTFNGCKRHTQLSNGATPLQEQNGVTMKQDVLKNPEKCVSCLKRPISQHLACGHCHRHVCSDVCLRVCFLCDVPYCHYCSVLRYDNEVRAICFDCLPLVS